MKTALCVGINDYPGADSDLGGCVNDAGDWHDVLSRAGYPVTMLVNEQATQAAMLQWLRTGLSGLQPGETFVFTFSGHGTWVPDRDGDEADGRDEALVPYDVGTGSLLLDDEIHRLFETRPMGTTVIFISDSCHSGTVARFVWDSHKSGQRRVRFLPPGNLPFDPHVMPYSAALPGSAMFARLERAGLAHRPPVKRHGVILMSGCRDREYSYDVEDGGRGNGAFTLAATRSLHDLRRGGGVVTFASWYKEIRRRLPTADCPQSPQLVADASLKILPVFP